MLATDQAQQHNQAMSVADLAAVLGVSARRVRQMRESGELIGCGRDAIDAAHAVNAVCGRRFLGRGKAADCANINAGVGWLLGHRDCGVGPRHLNAWFEMAAGWGLNKAEATTVLFNASALLGSNCPNFLYQAEQSKNTDG